MLMPLKFVERIRGQEELMVGEKREAFEQVNDAFVEVVRVVE